MQLGRPLAAAIALLTVVPLVTVLLVIASAVLAAPLGFARAGETQLYQPLRQTVRALTLVLGLLFAFYSLHLFRNRAVERDRRVSWLLAFLVFGPVAELVYWRRYVWPLDSSATDSVNQTMQLTASKPVVYASGVCRRERMLRRTHRGLAAADLVSR
jgi:hypothetical protein